MDLSTAIKKIRQKSFLTQEQFATELNVAFSTVNRWEKGKTIPNIAAMKQIKEYCKRNNISFVGEGIPLFSIIVFSVRCELKKITLYSDDVKVIQRDQTYATVKKIWDNNPDVMDEEKIDEIYESLKVLTNVDAAVKAAHIENIEKNYKNNTAKSNETKGSDYYGSLWQKKPDKVKTVSTSATETEEKPQKASITETIEKPEATPTIEIKEQPQPTPVAETNLICPKCGSKLVLRTAKKGDNAGGQFYGCSGFPKCRYIQSIKN
jgi:transcriptional regulator with XRE-family HTH domain